MKRTGLIIGLFFLVLAMVGCATPFDMAQTSQNAGDAAYKRGDYKGAIDNFKNAINQDPYPYKGAWRYEKLGNAYFKIGNYKDAIDAYKKCLERTYIGEFWDKYPNYRGKIASNVVASYQALKDLDSAVLYMEQLIAKDPNNYNYFRELGYNSALIGQYDKAIVANKRAIELNPQDAGPHNTLGYAYGKKKLYDEAFKAFRKSIEINPKNDVAYSNYGDFLAEKRDYVKASEQYEKAVSLKPNNRTYLSDLIDAYYKQGKYNKALDVTNKAILTMSFVGIGTQIQIVKDYPSVYSVFESGPAERTGIKKGDTILKIDGKSTKGWKLNDVISAIRGQEGTKVVFSIKRKDTKKPIEIAVIRENIIQDEASSAIGIRSYSLRHIGKKQESLKDAKQAYSLNSSDGWAQFALGVAYLDQGQYDEAIKLLSQVKDDVYARISEATAYAKKGDFRRAVDIYSSISEEKLSQKNVPLWTDRTTLLKALKPFIASTMESAGRLKAQRKYKEALKELGDALKVVDDKTSKKICGSIYRIMSMDPRLSELPEEARKYALRGDVLTEGGKFEDAVKEYRKAVQAAPYIAKLYFNTAMIYGELKRYPQSIRYMKTYLQLAPEAPNARAAKDQIYKWEFAMEKKN